MGIALPLRRYRFVFRAVDDLRLPRYPGSPWRGPFGHALKRAVCVTGLPTCPGCVLYRSCGYAYVLEEDGGTVPAGAPYTLGLT